MKKLKGSDWALMTYVVWGADTIIFALRCHVTTALFCAAGAVVYNVWGRRLLREGN